MQNPRSRDPWAEARAERERELLAEQKAWSQLKEERQIERELESRPKRGLLADIAVGAYRGATKGVAATLDAINRFDDWSSKRVGQRGLIIDRDGIRLGGVSAEEYRAGKRLADKNLVGEAQVALDDRAATMAAPERVTGNIAEGITQWAVGMAGASKFLKATNVLQKAGKAVLVARGAVASAAGSAVAFKGEEDNLFDLVNQIPGVENTPLIGDLSTYLAGDEDDSELEGRLKNGLADLGAGIAFEGLIAGARMIRAARKAAKAQPNPTPVDTDDVAVDIHAANDEADALLDEIDSTVPTLDDAADPQRFTKFEVGRMTLVRDAGTPNRLAVRLTGADRRALAGELLIKDVDGKPNLVLKDVALGSELRGSRLGPELIDDLIRFADRQGYTVSTDVKVSPSAQRMFERLKEAGYGVVKNETAEPDFAGHLVSGNGKPVYTITSFPDAPPPRADATRVNKITPDALKRPEAAKVVAAVIEQGNAGALSRAVKGLVDGVGGNAGAVDEAVQAGRAGGLNAAKIDWTSFTGDANDVVALMDTVEDAAADVVARATGGRVSMETTQAAAQRLKDDFGVEVAVDTFNATTDGGRLSAKLVASHSVLLDSANSLSAMARRIKRAGPDATEAMKREFFTQLQAYTAIHAHVRGSTTEVARALANLRAMRKAQQASATEFLDVARQLGFDSESVGIIERMAKAKSMKDVDAAARQNPWMAAWSEFFYSGLLSAPTTWATNFLSGVTVSVTNLIERPTAAALRFVANKASQRLGREVKPGVVMGEFRGMLYGTYRAHVTALQLPLRQVGKLLRAGLNEDAITRDAVIAEIDGEIGTVWKALGTGENSIGTTRGADLDTRKAIFIPLKDDPKTFYDGAMNGLKETLNFSGAALRFAGSRFMVTGDEYLKVIAYEQEIYARAFAEVDRLAKEAPEFVEAFGGRSKLIDDIADRMRKGENVDAGDEAFKDIHEEATGFAKYSTFQQSLDGFAKDVEGLVARNPAMRFIVPFIRTPSNIFRYTIVERTPLGLLNQRMREDLVGKNGARVADMARARLLIGTAALTGFMALDREALRGSGAKGRNSEDMDGVPPYSVKVGDKWYTYNRLDPWGMVLGLAADLRDSFDEIDQDDDGVDGADVGRVIAGVMGAISKNALSKTWLAGLSALIEAANDPDRYGENFLRQLGFALVVPASSLVRNLGNFDDPVSREAFGILEGWRANLPGAADALAVKRDYLGRKVEKRGRAGPNFLSPVQVGEQSDDPLDKELGRLRFGYAMPKKEIGGVKLTSAEYSRYLELRGQTPFGESPTLEDALRTIVQSPDYAALTDDDREAALKRVIDRYGEAARQAFLSSPEGARVAKAMQAQQSLIERRRRDAADAADAPSKPVGPLAALSSALGL